MQSFLRRLVFLTTLVSAALACTAMEPTLAMGDTESSVTFKFVSAAACSLPRVTLKNIDKNTSVTVPLWTSDEYTCPTAITYHRYSYFFKIDVNQGDSYTWSVSADNQLGPFPFKVRSMTNGTTARFVQIGDMDYSAENSVHTFSALNNLDWSKFDGLIHAGDFAYDLSTDQCLKGERYFNALSKVLTSAPTMFILGNHENYDTGKLFNYRFRLPNTNTTFSNSFYSQVRGGVFFLFVNYDYYLTWYKDSLAQVMTHLDSLLQKSQASDIMWKVVVSHRPIYCGEYLTRGDCVVNFYALKPFDDLYRKYKVDLLISGHEHFFERLITVDSKFNLVNNEEKLDDNVARLLKSPHPVQVINGCAGNPEYVSSNLQVPKFTSRAISRIQCYADIQMTSNALTYSLINSQSGEILDKTMLMRTYVNFTSHRSWSFALLFFLSWESLSVFW